MTEFSWWDIDDMDPQMPGPATRRTVDGRLEVAETPAVPFVLRQMDAVKVSRTGVVARTSALGDRARDAMVVRRFVEVETGRLLAEFTTEVLRGKLPPERVTQTQEVEFVRPAGWWDHFKQTYAGRWWARALVRRRPPRTVTVRQAVEVTVDLERFRVYPQASTSGLLGEPVPWAQWSTQGRVLP